MSRLFYMPVMGWAQVARGSLVNGSWTPLSPTYPPAAGQTENFLKVMTATGRGIGNNAAHEVGHQFSLPNMECGSTEPRLPCPGVLPPDDLYEFYSCSGYPSSQQPSGDQVEYLFIGAPLFWTLADANKLNKALLK
jgi:hypothetical protein